MRITVFGAGAIGSLVGGLLSARHEVTLVARSEHARRVNSAGLRVLGLREKRLHPHAVTSAEGLDIQDLVLITTKAYDTEEAIRAIDPLVGPSTIVMSLQNGLDNIEIVGRTFGARAVIGVTSIGVTLLGPGEVRWAGDGPTVVGPPGGRAEEVAGMLAEAGLRAEVARDILSEVWMKAIINASINPITALVGRENGCLAADDGLRSLCQGICAEGVRAAEENGIALPCADPLGRVMEVVERTGTNRSSMLQDVERGRRTEIDEITGALVIRGEAKGAPMPLNRAMWALVKGMRGIGKG